MEPQKTQNCQSNPKEIEQSWRHNPPGLQRYSNLNIMVLAQEQTYRSMEQNREHPDKPIYLRTSLVAQTVNHLPTMWETWVQSLSWEDLLEKEMATHSSILAWKTPWTEEPGRLQSMGSQRVGHD